LYVFSFIFLLYFTHLKKNFIYPCYKNISTCPPMDVNIYQHDFLNYLNSLRGGLGGEICTRGLYGDVPFLVCGVDRGEASQSVSCWG